MTAIETASAVATSLFGVGGLGVAIKWWLDKRKPALERNKVLADAAGSNVTSSLAIAAEWRAMANEATDQRDVARASAERYRVGYVAHRRVLVDLVEHWPAARQSPAPPDLPDEVH